MSGVCEPKCHSYGIGCSCRDLSRTTAEREGAEVEAVNSRTLAVGTAPRINFAGPTGRPLACLEFNPDGLRAIYDPADLDETAQVFIDYLATAASHYLAERERAGAERALREAADAALTMFDPPVGECIEWSEWLRARADHSDRADTHAEGGERP